MGYLYESGCFKSLRRTYETQFVVDELEVELGSRGYPFSKSDYLIFFVRRRADTWCCVMNTEIRFLPLLLALTIKTHHGLRTGSGPTGFPIQPSGICLIKSNHQSPIT